MKTIRLTKTQKTIAGQAGISQPHFSLIINKKRKPSAKLAYTLEEITGVDMRAWLFPEKFANPFVQNITTCNKKVKKIL